MEMDWTYHTPRADKHHPPSLGLEPTGKTEERKTMLDMEKTLQAELKSNSVTWEEVKRAAIGRKRWKLVVRRPYVPEGTMRNNNKKTSFHMLTSTSYR